MDYRNKRDLAYSLPKLAVGSSDLLPQKKGLTSTFNLSENVKTTMDFDKLVPVYHKELYPGDRFEVSINSLTRLAPTVTPIMDNVTTKFFMFWVPNRLLWSNFTKFMGEKLYPDDTTEYILPFINLDGTPGLDGVQSLGDYLGIPPDAMRSNKKISALPFRAYNKIYNDWFRANQLQEPVYENTGDGGTSVRSYDVLKKGKPLDYFTGCLPTPQAEGEIKIGLSGNATVKTDVESTRLNLKNGAGVSYVDLGMQGSTVTNGNPSISKAGNDTNLYADMSAVSGISIENLRKAAALQVLLEKDERSGERYSDLNAVHFGVTTPDFLVGRSQFLGSISNPLVINPITQNTSTDSTSPQGNLAGVGLGLQDNFLGECSAPEHGILMVLACTSSEINYQQGIHRDWFKSNRFDYMFPSLWNLGEQAVYNREIYATYSNRDEWDDVFGYQERFMELRQGINRVSGKMRSGVNGSLDIWQLAEEFGETPKLNGEFIELNTPIERVLAVQDEPALIMDINIEVKAERPLPLESNPSLLAGKL